MVTVVTVSVWLCLSLKMYFSIAGVSAAPRFGPATPLLPLEFGSTLADQAKLCHANEHLIFGIFVQHGQSNPKDIFSNPRVFILVQLSTTLMKYRHIPHRKFTTESLGAAQSTGGHVRVRSMLLTEDIEGRRPLGLLELQPKGS